MRPRRALNRLQLGPIVGHADDTSAKVWIQVFDDPADYKLRVAGAGVFDFVSTEGGALEFHTAIARAQDLRPELIYRYSVMRRGRRVLGGSGTFRTFPQPSSMAPIVFCAVSCSTLATDGVWANLAKYIKEAQPSFLMMMGDQVYIDEDDPNVFKLHYNSDPPTRRAALAKKYRLSWSRKVVQQVLANIPTYMIWDDHEIRDGFGSLACDSPTLVAKHTRGAEMFARSERYFQDCRDVYWHFQACHNPLQGESADPALPNYIKDPPAGGPRRAMPFVFRCGRVLLLVLESRTQRDVFRADFPILGAEQWQFIDQVFARLPADVDMLAIVTPTPIASMDPEGQVMKLMGERTDDIEAFKRGNEKGVLSPHSVEDKKDLALAIVSAKATRLTGVPFNVGAFKISNLDEARDQWSHKFSRPEQRELLRKANKARFANRQGNNGRELVFLSGDIHVGCIFDIAMSDPDYNIVSLTSSGISAKQEVAGDLFIGSFLDEQFKVASGIRSTLRDIVPDFNFGVIEVLPTGDGAKVNTLLAHEGNAFAAGLDISDLI
ncbi:MAG: alkaline phosphatase D family protein [Chthoniobacterales bacterium]|nr:alkaline phosphatase D family protein [Chthoniobacterales bacterium]